MADGGEESSRPPEPMSSDGAVMVFCGEDTTRLEDQSAEARREMMLPPGPAGLLSSAHGAVDWLAQGLLRERVEMDRERRLLASTWQEVQEARAMTAREKLHVEEEARRLEERGCDHARDLEARLSSAEVLELKEGRNIALVEAAHVGKEHDAAVAVITQARGKLDDAAAATARSRKEVDDAVAAVEQARVERDIVTTAAGLAQAERLADL